MRRLLFAALFAVLVLRAQITYKVRLTSNEGNRIVELSSEKYVAAVLAGESSTFRSPEALKAMAVAARTYAGRLRGRHASEGFDFCATTHCQRVDLQGITPQLTRAADATAGELLWFEGKLAFSVYARDCGGTTENVRAVWPEVPAPYLTVHADPYCTRHGAANWSWSARPQDIAAALRQSGLQSPGALQRVVIRDRTSSGRAKTLELVGAATNLPISASSFRFAIGRALGWNTMRSERYEIESANGQIHFRGTGEGHGVGLCQHGADEMGIEGLTYREILAFYYPGTKVARAGAGLKWVRLGGEGVAVFTSRPDDDRKVLMLAESLKRGLEARLHIDGPREITLHVYPDVEAFRNATGEPGWVAARTSGSNIDLQPAAVLDARGALRNTIRHELLHVFIESEAAAGLPLWFREGLVEWLNVPTLDQTITVRSDEDLRQRENRARAERAYHDAKRRVAALVMRYGEDVVLGWVKGGLPAEVRNSSESNAATKSK